MALTMRVYTCMHFHKKIFDDDDEDGKDRRGKINISLNGCSIKKIKLSTKFTFNLSLPHAYAWQPCRYRSNSFYFAILESFIRKPPNQRIMYSHACRKCKSF